MKNKIQTKDFKLISTKVFLLCLFIAIGSSQVFAQYNYVTMENGKEIKLSIPCNFSVMTSSINLSQGRSNFNAELGKSYANIYMLTSMKISSRGLSGNFLIEIPFSYYNYQSKITIQNN